MWLFITKGTDMEDFNEDDEFNLDNLGEADEEHTYEKEGILYLERIWHQKNGSKYRHTSIVDENGNILPPKARIVSSENVSDEDLNEMFKFRKTLPLNFLNALSKSGDNYNKVKGIRRHGRSIRVETLDEKLDRLEDEKMEAVRNQEYEKAGYLRDELDELKRNNEDLI